MAARQGTIFLTGNRMEIEHPEGEPVKIYVMTDLEGVAGVMDSENWCSPDSRYYEDGKELLTLEVNAAVKGFFEGGATEIVVADGHGPGALNSKLIDSRVSLMRGWPKGFPLELDRSYDAIAWVGQHAKAGTEYAHLAHTQSFHMLDWSICGISAGEFGQVAFCALELGVRPIFGSGDLAFTKEALALFPDMETVAVKYGTTPGTGEECNPEQYRIRNRAAVHTPPERARQMIYQGALRAMQKARELKDYRHVELPKPYEAIARWRAEGDKSPRTAHVRDADTIADAVNYSLGIRKPEG